MYGIKSLISAISSSSSKPSYSASTSPSSASRTLTLLDEPSYWSPRQVPLWLQGSCMDYTNGIYQSDENTYDTSCKHDRHHTRTNTKHLDNPNPVCLYPCRKRRQRHTKSFLSPQQTSNLLRHNVYLVIKHIVCVCVRVYVWWSAFEFEAVRI